MCVSVDTGHTLHVSLSHYQLAFHPVSHPSVQMVREAASVLALSSSTHIFFLGRKKKSLFQRSTGAK